LLFVSGVGGGVFFFFFFLSGGVQYIHIAITATYAKAINKRSHV